MDFNSEIQGYNLYPMLHFHRKFSSSIILTCELVSFMMIWICSGLSKIIACSCEGSLVVICILLFWGGKRNVALCI